MTGTASMEHVAQSGRSRPGTRELVFACFFLSGLTALVYEIAWARLLVHVFGATLLAVSTVLTVFMAGLGLGALAAGWRLERGHCPIRIYAFLELGIGLYALVVPLLLSQAVIEPVWWAVNQWLAGVPGQDYWVAAVRFVFAALVILLPTAMMGATLPVLCHFVAERPADLHRDIGYLYAVNTAGAVAGTVVSGFILIPALGLTAAVAVAACINIAVFAVLMWWRRLPTLGADAEARAAAAAGAGSLPQAAGGGELVAAEEPRPSEKVMATVIFVACLSGALSMVLQVTWTRFFALVFGSTTYAFSVVLAVFLAGSAAGSWLASRLLDRLKRPLLDLSLVLMVAGLYTYGCLVVLSDLPWMFVEVSQALRDLTGAPFAAAVLARAVAAAALVFVPAMMSGAVFPLAARLAVWSHTEVGWRVGELYAWNTGGAIIGSWLAGFVLIPVLSRHALSGMQATLTLTAALELCLAAAVLIVWLYTGVARVRIRIISAAAAAVTAGLLLATIAVRRMEWNPALMSAGLSFYTAMHAPHLDKAVLRRALGLDESVPAERRPQILYYREGLNTTVTVGLEPARNVVYLKNDGKVDASVPSDVTRPAPTSDLVTQVMLGALPVLLHPGTASRAFVIGYGSGTTVGSMLNCAEVRRVTVAELEEAVLQADGFFHQANNRPLRPQYIERRRVEPLVTDGRNYLSGTPERFDLIVSQPGDAWVNGMSDLFTREFFSLGKRRLAADGLFCQWVQLYSVTPQYLGVICRTFADVFPYTMVFHPAGSGEMLLVGASLPFLIDVERFQSRFAQPAVRADFQRTGLRSAEDVLAALVQGPAQFGRFCDRVGEATGDRRVNTDDNLITEYQLPRQLFSQAGVVPANLKALEVASLPLPGLVCRSGKSSAEEAGFLSTMALAFLSKRERGDMQVFYAAQARRLAADAVALSPSAATLWAAARVDRALGDGESFEKGRAAALSRRRQTAADWLAAGQIYEEGGDLAAAAKAYRQAAAAGAAVKPWLALARVQLKAGQTAAALASLETAGRADQLDPVAHSLRGYALAASGDREGAGRSLRRSLALDPTQFTARINLGRILCLQGKTAEGLDEFRAAHLQEPDSPLPYLCVVAAQTAAGQYGAAAGNLELLRKRSEHDSRYYLAEAVVAYGLDHPQKGEAALSRYGDMEKTAVDLDGARQRLARILSGLVLPE